MEPTLVTQRTSPGTAAMRPSLEPPRGQRIASVVIPGDKDQPTICSHSDVSRLLHYRLEVIEAALQSLIMLTGIAAATPGKTRCIAMQSFRTTLLIQTLRGILEAIEEVGPKSASRAELYCTLSQKLKELTSYGKSHPAELHIRDAA